MIYVYDIILNWMDSDKVYDFFEWELNDELEHVKKIPLFKIETDLFNSFLNYEITVEKDFLNKINNLTEVYENTKVNKIKFATLFTDGIRTLAVELNDEGKVVYRSKMLLDEEQDTIILSNKLANYDINITKGRKRTYDLFSTRLEMEIRKVLTIEIKDIYKKGEFDKLKYLYYECFGKEQNDIDIAYKKLLESIDKEVNYKHNNLYEVVKLSYQNKI